MIRSLTAFWRNTFDVREGERFRTLFMSLYLSSVLFVHYIMKPLARGLFLEKFDVDRLPYLYLLLAAVGGLLATAYSRAALRGSLQAAMTWAAAISALIFVGFWWALQFNWKWLLYAFNLWANLFGVVIVAQGWLAAANIFTSREAKRVYGVLGLGQIFGSVAGALFTRQLITKVGPRPLLLVCAGLVVLAYIACRLATSQKGASLAGARAVKAEEERVRVGDMVAALGRHRHLQVIIGIITLVFIVDQLIQYQFDYMADRYKSGQIIAFLAGFYVYSNLLTFVLQFFVTASMVSRIGVGGTMQVMPVMVTVVSFPVIFAPGVLTALIARLVECGSRYSFNRTGMELLYMPLPLDLRNRTKAFVDIAVDRMGRGMAAVLLLVLGTPHPQRVAVVVIAFAVVWAWLSRRAHKEYVLTVRRRLDMRRFELESARVAVTDPATLELLEHAAAGPNARQACYALSVLADAPGYDLRPLLGKLAVSSSPEVCAQVYELARSLAYPDLLEAALAEIRSSGRSDEVKIRPAVAYVLGVSSEPLRLAQELLNHADPLVVESALEVLGTLGEEASELVTSEWIAAHELSPDAPRRRLAALAIGVHGDRGTEALHRLLADGHPGVVSAACHAAGQRRNRAYVQALVPRLSESRLRAAAIGALVAYGTRLCGTLGDLLEDQEVSVVIRRQIPRVLRQVPDQRCVDVLLRSIADPDPSVRAVALKALNKLRETAPQLDYDAALVSRQVVNEARRYFELHATLEPLRASQRPRTASDLLVRTIEERLAETVERLFRLLGLRCPPKEIYAAYLAVRRGRREELSTALDFLDSVLDRELKRIVVPLLETPAQLTVRGRELFGIEYRTAESAIQALIQSGDPWLEACAMAAAAELKLGSLASDIAQAARQANAEVSQVARSALAALALKPG